MTPKTKPRIAVSIGDPSGIGAEVTIKALEDDALRATAHWVVIGDRHAISAAEQSIGSKLHPNVLVNHPSYIGPDLQLGSLRGEYGRASVGYVWIATEMCLKKEVDAMVTGPISKEAVTLADIPFTGHTEYIAELCGVETSRMLLINDRMMVLHVTTHCSLRSACEVEMDRVLSTIRLGYETLVRLDRPQGKIAVCGLNPHAGEAGLFGDEDRRVIAPAIRAAREEGIAVTGPIPGDTVFLRAIKGEFDMVVAMYHDQGHIPMKLLDFENTVNVSVGLPIIRTSVDHGTAFEIAGKNVANSANMKAAMRVAIQIARRREES